MEEGRDGNKLKEEEEEEREAVEEDEESKNGRNKNRPRTLQRSITAVCRSRSNYLAIPAYAYPDTESFLISI